MLVDFRENSSQRGGGVACRRLKHRIHAQAPVIGLTEEIQQITLLDGC